MVRNAAPLPRTVLDANPEFFDSMVIVHRYFSTVFEL